ncbi:MAG: hypothetical protein R3F43_22395 [bacterium]
MRLVLIAAVLLGACSQEEDSGPFSPYGTTRQDAAGRVRAADLQFSRPPPRDAGPDGTADARMDAVVDAQPPPPVDAALVDAAPPDAMIPACLPNGCTLAVVLGRRDPCPVALPAATSRPPLRRALRPQHAALRVPATHLHRGVPAGQQPDVPDGHRPGGVSGDGICVSVQ